MVAGMDTSMIQGDRASPVVAFAVLAAIGIACSASSKSGPGSGGTMGSAGSGGAFATGGQGGTGNSGVLPPGLGAQCTVPMDCDPLATCDVSTGTCVLPCALYLRPGLTVACPVGQTCATTSPRASSRCYHPCGLSDPASCPAGFVCQDDAYAGPVCLRAGSAGPGAACQATGISTGCANPGYVCSELACHKVCDFSAAEPGCPVGELCGPNVCTKTTGDPAPVDTSCAENSVPGTTCGSDGKAWRGMCNLSNVCGVRCDITSTCPAGSFCDTVACAQECDFWAAAPGCPAGLFCKANLGSSVGGTCVGRSRVDPAPVGANCTMTTSWGCGSDGQALRGVCASVGNVQTCQTICRTDADCSAPQHCREAISCI